MIILVENRVYSGDNKEELLDSIISEECGFDASFLLELVLQEKYEKIEELEKEVEKLKERCSDLDYALKELSWEENALKHNI